MHDFKKAVSRSRQQARTSHLMTVCLMQVLLTCLLTFTFVETAVGQSLITSQFASLDEQIGSGNSVLHLGSDVLSRISETAMPSVVHIQSERPGNRGGLVEETGSGVIMQTPGVDGYYVVTNRHVIQDAELNKIQLILFDGRITYPLSVIADKNSDIAVLRIPVRDVTAAKWGDSDKIHIGHMVLAMGSPFGLSQSVTFGIISAKGRRSLKLGATSEVINQDFLQTDAAINPGNSGGPLIDLQGNVVGINTAIASSSGGNEGIGFSIPANLARFVVSQLIEQGKVERAYLGVKLDPAFSLETARRLKLDRVYGARIMEVYANTPASRANLQIDDVVLSFDSIDIKDESHLINLVSLTKVNTKVILIVMRQGRRLPMTVLLGDRAELELRGEAQPYNDQEKKVVPNFGGNAQPSSYSLHDLDQDLIRQLRWNSSEKGCLILKTSQTDAELKPCDILQEVAGVPVNSAADLERILSESEASVSLLVKYSRFVNGKWETAVTVLSPESFRTQQEMVDTDL